jgi:hypothetical protein
MYAVDRHWWCVGMRVLWAELLRISGLGCVNGVCLWTTANERHTKPFSSA